MAIAGVPVLTGELINGDRRRQSDTLLVRECPSCRAPHLFRNAGIKTAACGLSCVVVAE